MCDTMTKRHPHADIIIAWAKGETVQVKGNGGWVDDLSPSFLVQCEYRIKPKQVVTETRISYHHRDHDRPFHRTHTEIIEYPHNLRLYWEGDKLVKAEAIDY